jgi:hypothetical protein
MLRWVVFLVFNVVLPLLPVPLVMLGSWMIGKHKKLTSIVSDGQLCFYCTGLAVATIYELLPVRFAEEKGVDLSVINILLLGMLVCIILSTFSYGIAVAVPPTDAWKIGWISAGCVVTTVALVIWARVAGGLL